MESEDDMCKIILMYSFAIPQYCSMRTMTQAVDHKNNAIIDYSVKLDIFSYPT